MKKSFDKTRKYIYNVNMIKCRWNEEKNELLKASRGISFEQVVEEIEAGRFIGPEENPAREGQQRIVTVIDNYPCVVPFVVENDGTWFLKTIYPCRKMKRRF